MLPLGPELTSVVAAVTFAYAIAACSSTAYGEALKALGEGPGRDFRIVEGLD
jgi:hypothetical protein